MTEDLELTRHVAAMTREACEELFRAYGVTLEHAEQTPWAAAQHMLCGVIGFVGTGIRGSCMLVGHDAPILASCPEGGRCRDWIGELTNQLAGRVKAKFLGYGVEVQLSTPVGLSGVALRPLPRSELEPTSYNAHGGEVVVWVEIDSDPAFALTQSDAPAARRAEGEVVLF
jgi:CheY-specific phosphatase CheX